MKIFISTYERITLQLQQYITSMQEINSIPVPIGVPMGEPIRTLH